MKCPVCDQENSTLLCPRCGFDASRDYGRYPTLAPVRKIPSVSTLRKKRHPAQSAPAPRPTGPYYVDYQKMVSDAAKEDARKREERRKQTPNISAIAYRELSERDMRLLQNELNRYHQMVSDLTRQLDLEKRDNQASIAHMERDLANWKLWHKNLSMQNAEQVLQIRKLTADLEAANVRIAMQQADLEAERNKGLISRLFNR